MKEGEGAFFVAQVANLHYSAVFEVRVPLLPGIVHLGLRQVP